MTPNFKHNMILAALFAAFLVIAPVDGAQAKTAEVIDAEVNAKLTEFKTEFDGGKELAETAKGILVFPSVVKAGFVVGGEYGEGALRVGGKTVDYYSTAAASFGLQLGAQAKTVMLLFMTNEALEKFRKTQGWEVGVDGSVAVVTLGAGGSIDTSNIKTPIVGVVFGNKGLMYNLTLEGSKMTKLDK